MKNLDIKVINTGSKSMTGGRIYRLKKYLKDDKFMLTYGDGLANIDLNKLIFFPAISISFFFILNIYFLIFSFDITFL